MVPHTDAFLAGLLDAAPDAIVAADESGLILLINAQAERLFGYGRDELVGKSIELLVPESLRDSHSSYRTGYARNPRPRPMGSGLDLAGRRKDGTTFPAEISLSSFRAGGSTVFAAAVRDATGRRRAESKFRGLLEGAPDAMVGVDGAGVIQLANAQTEALFGYTRAELIGQPVELLVPERHRAVHPDHRSRYAGERGPRAMGADLPLAGRRKDGTEFPAEISLSSFEADDGLLVTAAIRDVSERILAQRERQQLEARLERDKLEAQLQQSRRLESLGQLAGGVAHDFNNELAVILNYVGFAIEALSDAAAGDPSGAAHQTAIGDLETVTQATERAAALVRQLLVFGRREIVQPEVLDLNAVVSEVEKLLRRTIGEAVELVVTYGNDLDPVIADRGQLRQVLLNLAINARQAMPKGGKLIIDTANILVDEEVAKRRLNTVAGEPYVRLRVSDTGVGMPPEVQERAFEPFYTTKPLGEGTGLGLSTVYGIISQAGGNVQIYSEQGVGSTISIMLPAAPTGSRVVAAPADADERRRGSETILVVEDADAVREMARRILTRHGYDVLLATEGDHAIRLAEEHPGDIHLLLTDVVMPKMGGKEVAEQVISHRPDVRVLFMSGYAEPVMTSQGTLNPGVVLISKPFSQSALLDKVREVLEAP